MSIATTVFHVQSIDTTQILPIRQKAGIDNSAFRNSSSQVLAYPEFISLFVYFEQDLRDHKQEGVTAPKQVAGRGATNELCEQDGGQTSCVSKMAAKRAV